MSRRIATYILHYDGQELTRGDKHIMSAYTGMRADNVRVYAKTGNIYKKHYLIKPDKEIIVETKPKIEKAKEERLDYYIRHLEQYGNVASRKVPNEYIPLLAERGYKCRVLVYKEFSDTPTKRRGTKGYVIERID